MQNLDHTVKRDIKYEGHEGMDQPDEGNQFFRVLATSWGELVKEISSAFTLISDYGSGAMM